jgi:hypothetical protein
MEIRRTYLRIIIAFYSTLHFPKVYTVHDAVALWSNSFKPREVKAITQLIGDITRRHVLDPAQPAHKSKTILLLGIYIKNFERKLHRRFKDAGKNTPHCTRASVRLRAPLTSIEDGFKKFVDQFDNMDACCAKCNIRDFLLVDYRREVETYVKHAASLQDSPANQGFRKIAESLAQVLAKGPTACSCHRCKSIGDAVISLDAPRNMCLETLDSSFNHLCPPLHQPHHLHPSVSAFMRPNL